MIERPAVRPEAIPGHLQIVVMRVDDQAAPSLPELKEWLGPTDSREILKPHLLRRVWNLAQQLATDLDPAKSRALVFARTRRDTERYAEVLRRYLKHHGKSLAVESFHAGQMPDERFDLYERFQQGSIHVLVATKAFGMGMDIPNIHLLAHLDLPATLEDYLQEIGRAGRDRNKLAAAGFSVEKPIRCLMYYSPAEIKATRSFLRGNRINWRDLQTVLGALMDYSRRLHGSPQHRPMIIPLEAAALMPLSHLEDTGLRMALHWLERLQRITLGNFFPPCLVFRLGQTQPDAGSETWMTLARELRRTADGKDVIQVSMAALQAVVRVENPDELFKQLHQGVRRGLYTLENSVMLRLDREGPVDEWAWCVRQNQLPYPVRARLGFARRLSQELKSGDLELTRDQLMERIRQHVQGEIHEEQHGWLVGRRIREIQQRITEWTQRQARSIPLQTGPLLRILRQNRAVRVDTVIDRVNGISLRLAREDGGPEHNLPRLEAHCMKLLTLAHGMHETHLSMRLTDLLDEMACSLSELENAASLLCACGILKSDTLLGRSIRVDVHDFQRLDDPLPRDEVVRQEFNDHRRLGELRLASLDLAAHLDPAAQRSLFGRFFDSKSASDLQQCLEGFLSDPQQKARWEHEGTQGEIESLLRNVSGELLKQELYERAEKAEDQIKAITFNPYRSLIVEAGPGSGKTRVLVMRCAWLLLKENVRPDELLLLAYNRAVACELRLRLRKLFDELGIRGEAERIPVYTLHGFAMHVLGGRTRFLSLEKWETLKHELAQGSACAPHLLDKAKVIRRGVPDHPGRWIDGVQPPLECWIPWATRWLQDHPGFEHGRHILLDEMQDLTRDRLAMLKVLLDKPDATLFAVGDPDQSIYGYERQKAGDPSDPHSLLAELSALTPAGQSTERMSLGTNFRSGRRIVDAAVQRLDPKGNTGRQRTHRGYGEVILKDSDGDGTRSVIEALVGSIRNWAASREQARRSVKPPVGAAKDRRLAVLFRTNAELAEVESALQRDGYLQNLRGLRTDFSIGSDEFLDQFRTTREWLEVRNTMQSLPDIVDQETLDGTLLAASRKAEAELKHWNRHALKTGRYLARILATALGDPFLRDDLLLELDEAVQDNATIQRVIAVGRENLRALSGGSTDKSNTGEPHLRITLGTIHRAKGLEFDEVLVAPSRLDMKADPSHLAEERRVLYVACTRARDRMTLIEGPREMALREGMIYKAPTGLAPVITDQKDVYLDAMVKHDRFQDVADLQKMQQLIHKGLEHDQELLLLGNTIHTIEAGKPGTVIGVLSKEFMKRVEDYRKRDGIDESTPLAGLRVGTVIRRELEEDNQQYKPHPWATEQGFFWLVLPHGVLRPVDNEG